MMQLPKSLGLSRKLTLRVGCWVVLAALLLPVPVALAQAGADTPDDDETIRFEDYVLDTVDYYLPNGLRVILAEDSSAPVVAVDIWYHVGGANDPQGRSGFAH